MLYIYYKKTKRRTLSIRKRIIDYIEVNNAHQALREHVCVYFNMPPEKTKYRASSKRTTQVGRTCLT